MKTIILLLVVSLVGCSDYEEEVNQQAQYCEMVKLKLWGVYNPDIKCDEDL